ncbi:OmpP1/FadL family transporter [Desulfobaculum bizertense]|uniref:OmpP1/FadL family transporter n=1 Tax=Desulfobaculum bizertense TaxID=376490 RepID=UPI001F2D933F|nr:outer membrane protein transport protein [Desulfobaculum bizertense]
MRILLATVCMLGIFASQAFAAGYGIYEWSARGNALGGTLIARADDPSAVAYNPAGITQLEGINVMGGMTIIAPNATIKVNGPGSDGKGSNTAWTIPHAYYTHQMSDRAWFGLGVFSRVGLGTEYTDDESWAGRYNCSYAGIKAVSVNPNLAFKVTDNLSFAVGFEAMIMEFAFDNATDPRVLSGRTSGYDYDDNTYDIKTKLRAQGWAPGWNVGLHYKPFDWLAFGATYHSQIDMTVEGKAHFDANPGAKGIMSQNNPIATALNSKFGKRSNAQGTAPIPASTSFGVMVKPTDRLSIEIDAIHTDWSSYTDLTFEIDSMGQDIVSDKNWHDTWRYQVGAEYRLYDWMDLRAGYVFDESPIQDEYADYAVPGNDRQMVNTGVGMRFDQWTVDLSYSYLWMKGRDIEARPHDGVPESRLEGGHSHLIGMSVSYSF